MEQPRPHLSRRSLISIGCLTLVILALVFGSTIASVYTDWLWYVEDAGTSQVFAVRFNTRLLLFFIGLVAFTVVAWLNLHLALRGATVVRPAREGAMQDFAVRMLQFGQRGLSRIVWLVTPIVGILFGLILQAAWDKWLLFANAEPFGRADPVFGLDIGFYVFKLPFLHVMASTLLTIVLIPAIIVAAIYLAGQGVAGAGRLHLSIPRAMPHISVLFGVIMAIIGWTIWLGRYDALSHTGSLLTGVSYVGEHVHIPMMTVIAYGCWALALITIVFSPKLRTFRLHIGGIAVLVLAYLLGSVTYGSIVQATVVQPNELEKETPYIVRAIEFTRRGYMLDKVSEKEYPVREEPTAQDVAAGQNTLENMRLWDYRVLNSTYDALQTIRQYYRFQSVDVDRYMLNGKQTMVNIAVRELYTDGLGESAKTWQNLRFQYTHGMGVVINPVNEADTEGKPRFIVGQLPPESPPDLPVKESRIYFGELVGGPVFVNSSVREVDSAPQTSSDPDEKQDFRSFLGRTGIGVGSFGRRMLFGAVFGDIKVITTEAFRSDTKVLLRRNIVERASSILPFLHWDPDPYPVVADGRVYWMMDGYTVTANYPYSEHVGEGGPSYIRNSVKVTIDAATGEFNAYTFDPDDPILKVYNRIYPGILKPLGQMPASLLKHIRYPEQLFMAQCDMLQLYHVTDPRVWYQKEDRWALPKEATEAGQERWMEAYYVQMRIPDRNEDGFVLMLPFTPYNRPNLAAWLAAGCDPDDYGKLVLYRFPKDRNLFGPRQVGNQFFQNEDIAQWMTLMNQQGSQARRGNLLVMPLGKSLIYVEPFYLQSTGERAIPELKKVALGTQTRVAFGNTYEEALSDLFGEGRPAGRAGTPAVAPGVARSDTAQDALKRVLNTRREAKDALARGDWAAYGKAQDRLDGELEKLQRLLGTEAGQAPAEAAGPGR
jgi:uncharacterized membrane protein (UPF0182 family)